MKPDLQAPDDQLKTKFLACKTRRDVAALLEIPYALLVYHLFKTNEASRYRSFELLKRRGGIRIISAPATALKIIQRKLNKILQLIYIAPPAATGFLSARSISTNADRHLRKGQVLNIDILDCFGSINFGRVRGLFLHPPFVLGPDAATALAKSCCHNNALPQGAPTSPVISNMICARLDRGLARLAREHNLSYSRYADDISFSAEQGMLPRGLGFPDSSTGGTRAVVGGRLEQLITTNGFRINKEKVKIQTRLYRQEVTGLVVNEKRNVKREFVRQIRAMLHALSKFGPTAASEEFAQKYDHKQTRGVRKPCLLNVVRGKIEFLGLIRGKDDAIYRKYRRQWQVIAKSSTSLP